MMYHFIINDKLAGKEIFPWIKYKTNTQYTLVYYRTNLQYPIYYNSIEVSYTDGSASQFKLHGDYYASLYCNYQTLAGKTVSSIHFLYNAAGGEENEYYLDYLSLFEGVVSYPIDITVLGLRSMHKDYRGTTSSFPQQLLGIYDDDGNPLYTDDIQIDYANKMVRYSQSVELITLNGTSEGTWDIAASSVMSGTYGFVLTMDNKYGYHNEMICNALPYDAMALSTDCDINCCACSPSSSQVYIRIKYEDMPCVWDAGSFIDFLKAQYDNGTPWQMCVPYHYSAGIGYVDFATKNFEKSILQSSMQYPTTHFVTSTDTSPYYDVTYYQSPV